MWLGKFALITFMFCSMVLFGAYLMSQWTGKLLWHGWTREALEQLTGRNNFNVEANPTFIFGDFFAAGRALVTLIWQGTTGGVVADVLQGIPYFNNDAFILPIRFLYTFSLTILILSIVGRTEL